MKKESSRSFVSILIALSVLNLGIFNTTSLCSANEKSGQTVDSKVENKPEIKLESKTKSKSGLKTEAKIESAIKYTTDDIKKIIENFDIQKSDTENKGHTVSRHVGKDEKWMIEKLESKHSKAVSTYTDAIEANETIIKVLNENISKIEDWFNKTTKKTLNISFVFDKSIGYGLKKGESKQSERKKGVVILKRVENKFFVLTSYPA